VASERRSPPDRPLQDRPRARGLYPSGTLVRTLWRRSLAEPNSTTTSAWPPSPKAPDLRPAVGSCPANDASQGPGAKRQAPSYRGSGAPRRCPLGTALPATFSTRTRTGRDTRRQSFPTASRGSKTPRPVLQPLKLTSFTAKKTLEGPPREGWAKITQPDP
jgi:hypothetical protein